MNTGRGAHSRLVVNLPLITTDIRIVMRITLTIAALALWACAKPKISVDPCDEDLGYATRKLHLSNVRFLDEEKAVDWFEIYENLEERRKSAAPQKCIPGERTQTIEQQIERTEHDLKNLR